MILSDWPKLPLPVPPGPVSDGLLLRTWAVSDAAALAAAWGDEEIRTWLEPPSAEIDIAATWIRGEADRRAAGTALDLVIDVDGVVAGEVGFSAFDPQRRVALVGYWVAKAHRGNGLAARALSAAVAWFAEATDARGLVAECDPANAASWRTVENASFRRSARSTGGPDVYVLDL